MDFVIRAESFCYRESASSFIFWDFYCTDFHQVSILSSTQFFILLVLPEQHLINSIKSY